MSAPLVSMCWNSHSSALSTECKSLLDNNILVDCTIAAERQTVKAHRLILAACSPYFNMLFSEETEKHPIVILKDTSFETLRAVLDFVYCGETQIPEGNLKAFLVLAESLQIKGLKNSSCNNISCNAGGNVQHPSEGDKDHCEIPSTSAGLQNNFENSSLCHHLHHSGGSTEVVQTNSFASLGECSGTCGEVQAGSVIMPQQDQQSSLVGDELSIETEITVKDEPSEFLETKYDVNTESDDPMTGSFTSNVKDEGGTSAYGEQCSSSSQYSSSSLTSHGNLQSLMPPLQQHELQNLPFPEETSGTDLNEELQPILPVFLVPNHESGGEENDHMSNITLPTQTKGGQHSTKSSSSETVERRRRPCRGVKFVLPPTTRAGEPAVSASVSASKGPTGRPRGVDAGKPDDSAPAPRELAGPQAASSSSRLQMAHCKQSPTGERPCVCRVCGDVFSQVAVLERHLRRHTAGPPFTCNVCGDTFDRKDELQKHAISHLERPHRCNLCGSCFAQASSLVCHKSKHMGQRLHRCLACGAAFADKRNLQRHVRRHARAADRPRASKERDASPSRLCRHNRKHAGERAFKCDECGSCFVQAASFFRHKRTHAVDRHHCDVCGKSFTRASALARHKERHVFDLPRSPAATPPPGLDAS